MSQFMYDPDPRVDHAIRVIKSTYGDSVSVRNKEKDILKFGRNDKLGTTRATIMLFEGNETQETDLNDNSIDSLVCTDATFTGAVAVEGHYFQDGVRVFTVQIVTMNGQTPVPLTTPLGFITRIANASASNLAADTDRVFGYVSTGTTVTSGVPSPTSKIHILFTGKDNQSRKCATALSNVDYWIVTKIYGGILKKTSSSVDFSLQIKELGGVFRTREQMAVNSLGETFAEVNFDPFLIVPKNAIIRMEGEASDANVSAIAGIHGYLAITS